MSSLKKNISISFAAQVVSIVVSLVLNLFIPKAIDIVQFAHWQTYSLYAAFVGIFHFGILDGILLRYSEYDEDGLEWKAIKSQLKAVFVLTFVSALILALFSFFCHSPQNRITFLFLSSAIVTKNLVTYNLYLFQSTNRISKYVAIVLLQKIVFGIGIVILLLSGVKSFPLYCAMDIAGDILAFAVGFVWNRKVFSAQNISFAESMSELKANFCSGVFLLLSNWIAMLFIGLTRMTVQWFWDLETFGIVSYAFSLASFFLSFVTAVSVVIFPAMKRVGKDRLSSSYVTARKVIGPFMLSAMIFYFPVCVLLERWLPQYDRSYFYLGLMLPFVVFSSVVSLLSNNFLNSCRKERKMFEINIIAMILSALICFFFSFIVHNVLYLVAASVIPVALRSVLAEKEVSSITGNSFRNQIAIEMVVSACFILSATLLPVLVGSIAYLVCLLLMFLVLRLTRNRAKC